MILVRLKNISNNLYKFIYKLNFTSRLYAIFTSSEKKEGMNGDLRRTDQMP